jgi:hypothetical protein
LSAFKNIFCAAEQFFPIHGHIPPLARLLKTPSFTRSVGLFLIDEGHFISTAGQSHGKDPAHRPMGSWVTFESNFLPQPHVVFFPQHFLRPLNHLSALIFE